MHSTAGAVVLTILNFSYFMFKGKARSAWNLQNVCNDSKDAGKIHSTYLSKKIVYLIEIWI